VRTFNPKLKNIKRRNKKSPEKALSSQTKVQALLKNKILIAV
jgi:hypothetical protein